MTDTNFYRKYECNIHCYKMKASKEFRCAKCEADEIHAGLLEADKLCLTPGNVCMYSGTSPLGTTHTITSTQLPLLANRQCNGSIEFYLNNDLYVNVTMGAIVKANNTILQTLVYQRVGNFTSVEMTPSGNSIILTCNPQAVCKWVFRGI
jgi:hypothetical protein